MLQKCDNWVIGPSVSLASTVLACPSLHHRRGLQGRMDDWEVFFCKWVAGKHSSVNGRLGSILSLLRFLWMLQGGLIPTHALTPSEAECAVVSASEPCWAIGSWVACSLVPVRRLRQSG